MSTHSENLVIALEAAIREVGSNFLGERAFNFTTEADVQGSLLGRLRTNTVFKVGLNREVIELAHAEFPAYGTSWRGAPRHDLVVWNPDLAGKARENWGCPNIKWTRLGEEGLNLITVEMERFAGLPWNIRQYQMFSDDPEAEVRKKLLEHSDIRKLMECHCMAGYFLAFWDEDVKAKRDLEICFKSMHASFKKLVADVPRLRAYCTTRDGMSFSCGFQP